ncbi:MAG: hypothetical protein Q4B28_05945 [bacterium]|nr:hypothetical protein [bacterium]
MIIAMQGQSSAAIYSNYLSLINLFALGVLPLTGMLVPTFTALIGQGEQQKLEQFKTQLYTWMIVFAVSL